MSSQSRGEIYGQPGERRCSNHLRLVNESAGPGGSDPSPALKRPEPEVHKSIENVDQIHV